MRCQDCGEVITGEDYTCSCGMELCASCAVAHEVDNDHDALGPDDLWQAKLRQWNALVSGK